MSTSPDDLLIVGAGHLGRLIAQTWRAKHPSATIVGETGSEASHSTLREIGVIPALAETAPGLFPRVVFCAPPSKFKDYAAAASSATGRVTPSGRFVFTSSSAVTGAATHITEQTPADMEGPRSKVLAEVEQRVLSVPQGRVARLSGLYLVDRGPHTFWFGRGAVTGSPDAVVNLVHYRDVADAIVKILGGGAQLEEAEASGGRIFLICGGQSTSRRGICETALRHPMFAETETPTFGSDPAGIPKTFDSSWTRKVLGWKPQFESIEEFMQADAQRFREKAGV